MNNNQFGMNSTNNQMNSNNFSTNMNTQSTMPVNNNSKKGDKKTKLIIIIVALIIIIPILGILISKFMVGSIFNDTTKKVFVDDANIILDTAHMLVTNDFSNFLEETSYAPKCQTGGDETTIPFSNFTEITNFTINYNEDSFVKVKSIDNDTGICNYEYYIYLTDGTYSIGTTSNPVSENDLTIKSVKK